MRGWVLAGLIQAGLVAGLMLVVGSGRVPLGVKGEWVWSRVPAEHVAFGVEEGLTAGLGAGLYAAFVAAGHRTLKRGAAGRGRVVAWVVGLWMAGVGVQVAVQSAAPPGYGLVKWTTLGLPGSSGYFSAARGAVRPDLPTFLRAYPRWIAGQDALHIGTHPPGLIVVSHTARAWTGGDPRLTAWVNGALPERMRRGFLAIVGRFSTAPDRAAMAMVGSLGLLACAATVMPMFALARAYVGPGEAWGAAALWPLVPSAVLFQPTADAWYPLLSATALALAVWGSRGRTGLAVLSGGVLGVGMQFSLVYLGVGLIVGLVVLAEGRDGKGRMVGLIGTGLGFLAVTAAMWAATRGNPFVTWWCNARNHRRFYEQFPRSYWAWLGINPIEAAVGLGLPCVVWAALGMGRRGPWVSWATLMVLAVLTLSGRNLSEVARLWLPFFPGLLVACGRGMGRVGAGPGVTIGLLAIQTAWLQTAVQVVYPH